MRLRCQQHGQALTELVLLLPLFAVLILGFRLACFDILRIQENSEVAYLAALYLPESLTLANSYDTQGRIDKQRDNGISLLLPIRRYRIKARRLQPSLSQQLSIQQSFYTLERADTHLRPLYAHLLGLAAVGSGLDLSSIRIRPF